MFSTSANTIDIFIRNEGDEQKIENDYRISIDRKTPLETALREFCKYHGSLNGAFSFFLGETRIYGDETCEDARISDGDAIYAVRSDICDAI